MKVVLMTLENDEARAADLHEVVGCNESSI
jgi:hypothetical protein